MNTLDKPILKKIWRALAEFSLLEPGDKVLIGYSGGKDSLFLALALSQIQKDLQFPIQLACVHIDLGFGLEIASHREYLEKLGLPLFIVPTKIGELIAKPNRQNPCSRCAYFRRGALKKFAQGRGYTKIALAHHNDDAVETLLMSLLYSGQIKTLAPNTIWDQSGLTIIRPLIYLREHHVRKVTEALIIEPLENPCPHAAASKRGEIKKLIHRLSSENPTVYSNLASSLRAGRPMDLWPEALPEAELKKRFAQFASSSGTDNNNES